MAAIQPKAAGPPPGSKRRATKLSTCIDKIPMVGLAFLLLTFFVLTPVFAKPCVLGLAMPVADNGQTRVDRSTDLTTFLGKGHRVHCFLELNAPHDQTVAVPALQTAFVAKGIQQVLLRDQQRGAPQAQRGFEVPGHV